METFRDIALYFINNTKVLNDEILPVEIIDKIRQLNRADKANLKALLFNEAKKMALSSDAFTTIAWLEHNFSLIEKYSFRFHQVFFSPGDEIPETIIGLIKGAEHSVHLCIFTISHIELAKELELALQRGLDVRIITDDEKQFDKGSCIKQLQKVGIAIRMDHSKYHMHHKFGIIDHRIVFTGSFNWTYTATKHNQENLLITSNFDIVRQYNQEYERLWMQMK